jgi:hypothetical protein
MLRQTCNQQSRVFGSWDAAGLVSPATNISTFPRMKRILEKGLASHILQMIDNLPAWENVRPDKEDGPKTAHGAIESYGQARPRD